VGGIAFYVDAAAAVSSFLDLDAALHIRRTMNNGFVAQRAKPPVHRQPAGLPAIGCAASRRWSERRPAA